MNDVRKMGRVTIPTDTDAVSETLNLLKRWGADAIRDCDGTEFPQELKDADAKIYSTYYTTRKDNAWAKANPDEVPLVNQFIIALKDSTILYAIGLSEVMYNAKIYVGRTMESFATYTWVAVFFLLIVTVLSFISRYVERRMNA
mgnify:CR=1 FL=1